MGKEIVYFLKNDTYLIAGQPRTGETILFNEKEKKWGHRSHDLFQVEGEIAYEYGSSFRPISEEEAQAIFGDTPPKENFALYKIELFDNLSCRTTSA